MFDNSSEYLVRKGQIQDKATKFYPHNTSDCLSLVRVSTPPVPVPTKIDTRWRRVRFDLPVRVPGIYPHHKSVLPSFNTLGGAPQNAIVAIHCRIPCLVAPCPQCVAVIQARDRANMDVIASVLRFIQRCQTVSIVLIVFFIDYYRIVLCKRGRPICYSNSVHSPTCCVRVLCQNG